MPRKGDKVYKRKDGLWEARYVKGVDADGKKVYASVYGHTCGEAKDKRQLAMDNILLCTEPVGARNITIGRLVDEWLFLNKMRLKSASLNKYENFRKLHIMGIIDGRAACSFGTVELHEYGIQRLESGLSSVTVNALLVFLHSVFKYGHRQYGVPMPDFMYLPKERGEMRVLNQEEQLRLEAYLMEDMDIYKFGVLLTLYTGLRVGELCALRWCDLSDGSLSVRGTMQRISDGESSRVVVGTPKTTTSNRVIPMPAFLTELAERFRGENDPQDFILSTASRPVVEPRLMQHKLKKYFTALDIDGATFHTLRHSFATRCVDKYGFEIKTLSEILGHSTIEMTLNRYVHSSMELKRSNMDRLRPLSLSGED